MAHSQPDRAEILQFSDLKASEGGDVMFTPTPAKRAEMAQVLGLLGLDKARLSGRIEPLGAADWVFRGRAEGTVTQACVVTLDPVRTRIEEDFERKYLAEPPEPGAGEVEMPEDDTVEPLPDSIDLPALLTEALALALPAYPRAEGTPAVEAQFAGPGIAPMTDEDARPFAGLKALRDKLADEGEDGR